MSRNRILPGFGLSLGVSVLGICLVVLLPLAAVVASGFAGGWDAFAGSVTAHRTLVALWLSLWTAFAAATIAGLAGLLVAWVLVRYAFPGRRLIDALIDLPFALPTAVAGITLTTIYAPGGWIGGWLESVGIRIAFTPLGIIVALVFIGVPFVVRTLQPVLEEASREIEEAASSLGASRWQVFTRVLLPELRPALLTGFALAFARGMGEYGSVVFISGNLPGRTEIAPLVIMTRLESQDLVGATALAVVMLAASFVMLLIVNLLQRRLSRRMGA